MTRRTKIAAALAVGAALMIAAPASAANGAQKATLLASTNIDCTNGSATGTDSGFAVINVVPGPSPRVMATVALKSAPSNQTWNVYLVQSGREASCGTINGTLTTNVSGNGTTKVDEALIAGGTRYLVLLLPQSFGGGTFITPAVTAT
jgi:hypothetical protein